MRFNEFNTKILEGIWDSLKQFHQSQMDKTFIPKSKQYFDRLEQYKRLKGLTTDLPPSNGEGFSRFIKNKLQVDAKDKMLPKTAEQWKKWIQHLVINERTFPVDLHSMFLPKFEDLFNKFAASAVTYKNLKQFDPWIDKFGKVAHYWATQIPNIRKQQEIQRNKLSGATPQDIADIDAARRAAVFGNPQTNTTPTNTPQPVPNPATPPPSPPISMFDNVWVKTPNGYQAQYSKGGFKKGQIAPANWEKMIDAAAQKLNNNATIKPAQTTQTG